VLDQPHGRRQGVALGAGTQHIAILGPRSGVSSSGVLGRNMRACFVLQHMLYHSIRSD
jgi:hypothetical protein